MEGKARDQLGLRRKTWAEVSKQMTLEACSLLPEDISERDIRHLQETRPPGRKAYGQRPRAQGKVPEEGWGATEGAAPPDPDGEQGLLHELGQPSPQPAFSRVPSGGRAGISASQRDTRPAISSRPSPKLKKPPLSPDGSMADPDSFT